MSTFESIIPNKTPLVADLEKATAFDALPEFEGLGNLSDPQEIEPRFLPWLAYRFATDLWVDDWGVEKRRSVVAQQPRLHKLKGTLAGTSAMLALIDAGIVQTLRYPQRAFAMAGITKAQRDEWLSRMPQIRVYLQSRPGTMGADGFGRGDGVKPGGYAGHLFTRLDRAEAIYGRNAVLRSPDGAETPLRRASIERTEREAVAKEFDRIHLPGEAGPALFAGRFAGHDYLTMKAKQPEIVSYALDRSYSDITSKLHLDSVSPGLEPVDVKYRRVSDRGRAGMSQFAGQFVGRYASDDRGAWLLYDMVHLHDRSVDVPWSRAHTFAGHTRVGMPTFTAEMLVMARSKRKRRATYARRVYSPRSFALKEDLQFVKTVYYAIRQSKAVRDRIKVDTNTLREWRWGDTIPMDGTFKFGKRTRNRL